MADKVETKWDHITLKVNDSIGNETRAVCNIFIEYFSNVVSEMGNEQSIDENESIESVVKFYSEYQSIKGIREFTKSTPFLLDLQEVCESDIKIYLITSTLQRDQGMILSHQID